MNMTTLRDCDDITPFDGRLYPDFNREKLGNSSHNKDSGQHLST